MGHDQNTQEDSAGGLTFISLSLSCSYLAKFLSQVDGVGESLVVTLLACFDLRHIVLKEVFYRLNNGQTRERERGGEGGREGRRERGISTKTK